MKLKIETPWGPAQTQHKYADDLIYYSTARHGGYWLSLERRDTMPDHLRHEQEVKGCWFEEDCERALVICSFPHLFESWKVLGAYRALEKNYANAFIADGGYQKLSRLYALEIKRIEDQQDALDETMDLSFQNWRKAVEGEADNQKTFEKDFDMAWKRAKDNREHLISLLIEAVEVNKKLSDNA